jgi:hypothetical protein
MDDGLFRLTRDHRAIPMSTRAASKLQRLDFYAPTGFFTGQIRAGGSTSESGSCIPASSVPFRGLILPPSSYGGGFYFFPKSLHPQAEHCIHIKCAFSPINYGWSYFVAVNATQDRPFILFAGVEQTRF